jgi:hypothetical protein
MTWQGGGNAPSEWWGTPTPAGPRGFVVEPMAEPIARAVLGRADLSQG